MLLKMKLLFTLFALLALVLAPFALAPASAAMQASHCEETMPAMDHGQQSVPHKADVNCCPAGAPAMFPVATGEAGPITPALLPAGRRIAALLSIHPAIEIPPPRA